MIRQRKDRTPQGYLQHLTRLGPILGFALLVIASGCSRESKVEIATREKILIMGNGAEPKALDPHIVSSVGDSNILRALFEGLVAYHPTNDMLHEPGVAERWEANEDFSEWTFYLRKNAKWSNGDPVTAHDFIYSYNRILHPEMAAPYSSMLYFLKNAEEFNKGEIKDFSKVGVKAEGDFTLICKLKGPTPYFPDVVKHTTWLPVHGPTIEKFGNITDPYTEWQKPGNHVSNGAFILTAWRINAYVKVRRNPNYWDGANVKPNGIDFKPIDNVFTEEKAFRNGLLHYTYVLPENLIAKYKEASDPRLRTETYAGSYFYRCNVDQAPTDNVSFRRALAYAIDQETIVEFVTRGGQQPAYGFTPPSKAGYDPPKIIAFDPEKARLHLKEAGYESGSDVPEFTVIINTSEAHKSIAVAIQDMWKKHLGIEKVKIENQEWKVFQQTVHDTNYEVSRAGWIGDYVDPNTFLSMWVSGDSNNNTGWSNAEFDRLMEESGLISDPAQRYATLKEAERILLNDLPILPIYWYTRTYLIHPDVKNWHPLLLDNHPYKYIDLVSEEDKEEVRP
ncbi:MAG: peptide ABC transporter substrate-binding protein [Verrucomicrobiales bacterium]|nr:peptide ABC transporter substrate-binding protein [Verrucomicrobiales bacterium]|tara:strand:+ start:39565 stop:41253 length:1689 start_codon:yes stop_codon:yes gene_type:complete